MKKQKKKRNKVYRPSNKVETKVNNKAISLAEKMLEDPSMIPNNLVLLNNGKDEDGKVIKDIMYLYTNESSFKDSLPNFIEEKDRVVTELSGDLLKDIEDNNGIIIPNPDIPITDYMTEEISKIYVIVHIIRSKDINKFLFIYTKRSNN